uniref:G-protein coupled receptors family 1 profile domain-containing protein n=1 Tax=Globodera rostochiensis TaxID=31243 RepID=A0A914H625_GLORO
MNDTDFNANNTLYQMYRDVYPCWPFIIGAVTINLVALFGMIGNFGVIWVTYCTKTLHGTANLLIALCCFFELLHQHGHWLFLYTALSGQNFLPFTLAIRICTVSLFGLGGTAMSMTFTGLDRLLCVLFPAFPNTVRPMPYLCAIMLICSSVSILKLTIYYESVSKMPNLMTTGTIGDLMKIVTSQRLLSVYFLMHSITIVLYVVVGIVVRKKSFSNSSNAEKKQRRIFRSLCIIILLNVGGYYFCVAFMLFVRPNLNTTDPIISWTIFMVVAILTVNVSAASNGPVLYMTSKEYQKAFQDEFGKICGQLIPKSASNATNSSGVPNL